MCEPHHFPSTLAVVCLSHGCYCPLFLRELRARTWEQMLGCVSYASATFSRVSTVRAQPAVLHVSFVTNGNRRAISSAESPCQPKFAQLCLKALSKLCYSKQSAENRHSDRQTRRTRLAVRAAMVHGCCSDRPLRPFAPLVSVRRFSLSTAVVWGDTSAD